MPEELKREERVPDSEYVVKCIRCGSTVSVGVENFKGCFCDACEADNRKYSEAQCKMEVLMCESEVRRWKRKLKKAKKRLAKYSIPDTVENDQ